MEEALEGLLVSVYVFVNMRVEVEGLETEICFGHFWVFFGEKKHHSPLNKPLTLGRLMYSHSHSLSSLGVFPTCWSVLHLPT